MKFIFEFYSDLVKDITARHCESREGHSSSSYSVVDCNDENFEINPKIYE